MKTFIHFIPTKALLLTLGLLSAGWQSTIAQTRDQDQQTAPINDQTLVSAIAPYRDDVRRSILLASVQPQVLTALAQQRANSEQAFANLIQSYGQTKQGWFYDLSRYPDILHALATLPTGSDEQTVNNLTKPMPATIQVSAWKLYRHHNADLVQVDNINQQAQQAFENVISTLDGLTQSAFRQLIEMPDVMTQLTDQIDKTARLGEAYQANPDQVTKDLTALHDSLQVQNQQELADYQNQLNNDPQARQELQQAGQAYAQANGYNMGINPNPAWVNTSYYYQNPYSFWFGYPYWYASPLWYPSAWWYGTGFYYGMGGNMVMFGLPSLGFSNWFFGSGRYVYPHLYNRFNTYYTHNLGQQRILTPGNAGFMSAARRTFGSSAGRGNWLNNAGQYNRSGAVGSAGSSARIAAPGRYQGVNPGVNRSQSWGGGGMRSFGGGFSGGGFHGGGRR
ncbi:DUF3300 domain-containing protein [Spirosoma sp. KCTC 42546]|uniref:DUF3300 domain-containing protein n=1 Tax=Spirosoma sp. KCTC 42546 TaxID=2520506 RepID=UPI001157D977|nr:DUF3300 domain-containing protein [Spirosoma sp. KCTC 42546]QDK79803.1 DUF3300 domain-containing protein [Spirosoma sp. KCTC 42546]